MIPPPEPGSNVCSAPKLCPNSWAKVCQVAFRLTTPAELGLPSDPILASPIVPNPFESHPVKRWVVTTSSLCASVREVPELLGFPRTPLRAFNSLSKESFSSPYQRGHPASMKGFPLFHPSFAVIVQATSNSMFICFS